MHLRLVLRNIKEKPIHRTVVVHSSKSGIEIDCGVEEAARRIAHQRAQEGVDRHQMTAHGVQNVREIFIALESKFSDGESFIAEIPAKGGSFEVRNACCAHTFISTKKFMPFGRDRK